jgi:hypothetical protein
VLEGRVEEAVFDSRGVIELPEGQGELADEGELGGGGGAVFFDQFLEGGGEGELGAGVGDGEVGGRGGGGEAVGTGVLRGALLTFRGAGAGGVLGVEPVAGGAVGVDG